jgi:hypothetical protein
LFHEPGSEPKVFLSPDASKPAVKLNLDTGILTVKESPASYLQRFYNGQQLDHVENGQLRSSPFVLVINGVPLYPEGPDFSNFAVDGAPYFDFDIHEHIFEDETAERGIRVDSGLFIERLSVYNEASQRRTADGIRNQQWCVEELW